ncbi:MAG: hypothetical protein FWE94_03260 [Coriobacteriia bacterium]|nr:hypothetical protein [Coriobacteriia bacterium]
MRKRMIRWAAVTALLMLALTAAGCSTEPIAFTDNPNQDYTRDSAQQLLSDTAEKMSAPSATENAKKAFRDVLVKLNLADAIEETPGLKVIEDVSRGRRDALVRLRRKDAKATEAADLITRVFPQDMVGVPFYVESAKFDSTPSIMVIEWIGYSEDGRSEVDVTSARLWVLDMDGNVLFSAVQPL